MKALHQKKKKLYNFLKESKFLLLIDDLWETLDLEEVGIPQGCRQIEPPNRQLLIITTRLHQVCYGMNVHAQIIELNRLELNEAWSLFEANAGTRVTANAQTRGYAESIVKRCGGLPLALKIVGKAMASKDREYEWKYTVNLLEQSQFNKVPDAEVDLYSVLYISYDHLPDERTKQCFLLFVLDHDGNRSVVSRAIELWMGHGLLDEGDDTRNSYLRGYSIVGCLKRACLLEEEPLREKYLRMHDCIRDLALWIVQTKQGGGPHKKWLVSGTGPVDPKEWNTAERICLSGKYGPGIPDSCSCPHLLTLVLVRNDMVDMVPAGFFATALSLTYLDLGYTSTRELPSDVGALVNLQCLNLSHTKIRSLPIELQLLKKLRYLYLGFTWDLRTIPDGTISALSALKVLDMYDSAFSLTCARIDELERVTSLQFLGCSISDCDSLKRILRLPGHSLKSLEIGGIESLKRLHVSPVVSLEGFRIAKTRAQQLERLRVEAIESMEEFVMGETNVDPDWQFQSLVELLLLDLPNLKSIIWRGAPSAFLPGLRELVIWRCHSIKTVTWIQQLPCLEEVYLLECRSLLELVSGDDETNMSPATASFPRLRLLGLSDLENLQKISVGTIALPCLQRLLAYKCPRLEIRQSEILSGQYMPLVFGEHDWWEKQGWEGTSSSIFRELPETFKGEFREVHDAVCR